MAEVLSFVGVVALFSMRFKKENNPLRSFLGATAAFCRFGVAAGNGDEGNGDGGNKESCPASSGASALAGVLSGTTCHWSFKEFTASQMSPLLLRAVFGAGAGGCSCNNGAAAIFGKGSLGTVRKRNLEPQRGQVANSAFAGIKSSLTLRTWAHSGHLTIMGVLP